MTFQDIGAPGWYPSMRDPSGGQCDAYLKGACCMAKHELTGSALSPWNEELIMTLRGPMLVKQIAVYQPSGTDASSWDLNSLWDGNAPAGKRGIAFQGNGADTGGPGIVGNKCMVDVSTDTKFPCGPGSVPYCQASAQPKYYGWQGSKMMILLASMPHVSGAAIDSGRHCSLDKTDNWYDAPWIGLSHGELVRAGKFGGCNCYAKDPTKWQLADGCGQFNVFETVNDNNAYQNFELFSTNFFAYHGYIGEGPCGKNCNVANLDPKVDLIDKSNSLEMTQDAIATPQSGSGAAFRRPAQGFRYFIILMDVDNRSIQLALIHPGNVPPKLQSLLPSLPVRIPKSVVTDMLALRLPGPKAMGIIGR